MMDDYKKLWKEECQRTATQYAIIQMMSANKSVNSCIGDKSVAIYGIGMMGSSLFCLLNQLDIKVKYAIDRRGGASWNGIKVYKPEDELPEVDFIVITVDSVYMEMQKNIASKGISYMSIHEFVCELINVPFNY